MDHKGEVETMNDTKSSTRIIGGLIWDLIGLEWTFFVPTLITLAWALPLTLLGTTWGHALGIAWAILYGLILLLTAPAHLGIFSDAIRVAFRNPPRVIPRLERNTAQIAEARKAMPLWVRLIMDGVSFANPLSLTSLLSMFYVRRRANVITKAQNDIGEPPLGYRTAVTIFFDVRRRERAVEEMTSGHEALAR
jgi:hypothetical protein